MRCSKAARLLFTWSWCFFDDEGVHPADALQLKAEVFPGDSDTEAQIQEWINELIAQDCISLFEVAAQRRSEYQAFRRSQILDLRQLASSKDRPSEPNPRPDPRPVASRRGESDAGKPAFSEYPSPSLKEPAKVADQSALWEQALLWARESFMGMDLSRRSQDRSLALKVCYLVISGKLEQGWLTEATKATKKAMSINPAGKAFRAGAF